MQQCVASGRLLRGRVGLRVSGSSGELEKEHAFGGGLEEAVSEKEGKCVRAEAEEQAGCMGGRQKSEEAAEQAWRPYITPMGFTRS